MRVSQLLKIKSFIPLFRRLCILQPLCHLSEQCRNLPQLVFGFLHHAYGGDYKFKLSDISNRVFMLATFDDSL